MRVQATYDPAWGASPEQCGAHAPRVFSSSIAVPSSIDVDYTDARYGYCSMQCDEIDSGLTTI